MLKDIYCLHILQADYLLLFLYISLYNHTLKYALFYLNKFNPRSLENEAIHFSFFIKSLDSLPQLCFHLGSGLNRQLFCGL